MVLLWDDVFVYMYQFGIAGTRDSIESASRCMFGVELADMSLLYYLMYVQAAGGIEPLISAKENMGQEFRVSVRNGGDVQIV